MEYKPPFENKPPKYRLLYCSMDNDDEWKCVRCEEDKLFCDPSIPSFQSQKTRVVSVPNDLPKCFDQLYLMNHLSSTKIEMKK